MLDKFKDMQQEKLDNMLSEQAVLKQQAEVEQQRLAQLKQFIDEMQTNNQMGNAIGLQNLAGMKHILHGLTQQQAERVTQLQGDQSRQQLACIQQLSFTKGLEGVIAKKAHQTKQKQARQHQNQLDELVAHAAVRRS